MNARKIILLQFHSIIQGGWPIFLRKFLVVPALLPFIFIRFLRPWLLIRLHPLMGTRIGHFAANTELYLCERDAGINVPQQRYVDLSFCCSPSNEQLLIMWARCMRIWPAWLLRPVLAWNRIFPGGSIHEVGSNSQGDRDVHNLYDRMPVHIGFTAEEEHRGKAYLLSMGVPADAKFICMIARDNAYLDSVLPTGKLNPDWRYHDYRNVDIQTFVLAAETLARLGYYVIRMGAVVKDPIKSRHPNIIDYAANGMRTDFMDIYLGANCMFCITSGTGFDAIPTIFRKPLALVDLAPVGYLIASRKDALCLTKKYWLASEKRWLSLKEIFCRGAGYLLSLPGYKAQGVELVDNSPEEIRSVVVEMLERLNGDWKPEKDDEALQRRFWEIFPVDARDISRNRPLHGKIHARYGAQFLRDNQEWLE